MSYVVTKRVNVLHARCVAQPSVASALRKIRASVSHALRPDVASAGSISLPEPAPSVVNLFVRNMGRE